MGYVTTYEILAMLGVALVLVFNAGFAAGAAWRANFQREDDASARIDSPRTIEDAARRGGV